MSEMVLMEDVQESVVEKETEKPRHRAFAIWTVKGVEYKLKLSTNSIIKIENKLGKSMLSVLEMKPIPPIATMLYITQEAMKDWNHGITLQDVYKLFDDYCAEGGSQLEFMTNVFMDIYVVSGFFTENQNSQMEENLAEARAAL